MPSCANLLAYVFVCVCMLLLTCTFIGIIIAVVVFSVVLILFALFRHFYSWTALRELHKGIESSVLGTEYTGSGLPNFAARDHSDYKQTHTHAQTHKGTLHSYSAHEMYSHTFACYGILLAAFYSQRVSR